MQRIGTISGGPKNVGKRRLTKILEAANQAKDGAGIATMLECFDKFGPILEMSKQTYKELLLKVQAANNLHKRKVEIVPDENEKSKRLKVQVLANTAFLPVKLSKHISEGIGKGDPTPSIPKSRTTHLNASMAPVKKKVEDTLQVEWIAFHYFTLGVPQIEEDEENDMGDFIVPDNELVEDVEDAEVDEVEDEQVEDEDVEIEDEDEEEEEEEEEEPVKPAKRGRAKRAGKTANNKRATKKPKKSSAGASDMDALRAMMMERGKARHGSMMDNLMSKYS